MAREIKERNAPGKIIFITGGNDYVTEAFELKAFSYIQKPVEYEKFSKVLSHALETVEKVKYMEVMVDREPERIYLEDVEYVETMGRRLLIHLHEDDMETYMSMKAFMDQHGKDDFFTDIPLYCGIQGLHSTDYRAKFNLAGWNGIIH